MNASDETTNEARDELKAEMASEIAAETSAPSEAAAADEGHKALIEPTVSTTVESAGGHAEAPTLALLPWLEAFEEKVAAAKPAAKPGPRFDLIGIAASLAAVGFLAVTGVAGFDHMRQSALIAGKTQENQDLVQSVAALKTRIEAVEAARSQEQSAELRKTLGEIKATAAAAQGYGASINQMAQRVDKLEKDQNARFDKLAERIDQTSSTRYGEIVARLDKLEKKPATVAIVTPPPPPPAPNPAPAKPQVPVMPNVANDVTGSIDKPKPVLRGYALEDIRDGMALIESRDGPFQVSPGDILPGAGRVLKIERRGRDWVVVTSSGVITTPQQQ